MRATSKEKLENDRYMKTGNCAHCELKSNMYGAQARAKAQFEKARMQHSLQEHLHELHPRRSHAVYWPPIHQDPHAKPPPKAATPNSSGGSASGDGIVTRVKDIAKAANPLHMMSGALPPTPPPDEEAAVGEPPAPPAPPTPPAEPVVEPPPPPGRWAQAKEKAWQAAPYAGAAALGAMAARPGIIGQVAGGALGVAQAVPVPQALRGVWDWFRNRPAAGPAGGAGADACPPPLDLERYCPNPNHPPHIFRGDHCDVCPPV
jgi:hypothetical protein